MPKHQQTTPAIQTSTRETQTVKAGRHGQATVIKHLLAANAFARLSNQATLLRKKQALLEAALPAYLLPGTRIVNIKRGKVIIHAQSGAVAVKLRQLAPRLSQELTQQDGEVTGITVRTQARNTRYSKPNIKSAKVLGNRSKQALASLAQGLAEDSPVKRALLKLIGNG